MAAVVRMLTGPDPSLLGDRRWWTAALAIVAIIAAVALGGCGVGHNAEPTAGVAPLRSPIRGSVAGRVGFSPGPDLLWGSDDDQVRELDLMVDAGASWVRIDFQWRSIQPEEDEWYWEAHDRLVANATARDLRVVGIPAYQPDWAERPARPGVAPFDVDAFIAFTGEVVDRYAPVGVRHWEIWNEPNQERYWRATPDPEAYATVLRRAAGAVRKVDPDAFVISGGLAPAPDDPGDGQLSPATFLARMYDAGVGPAVDAVAMHPYSYPLLPTEGTAADNAWLSLSELREIMVAAGAGDQQLWLTEMGAPTDSTPGAFSEEDQAAYVREAMVAYRSLGAWAGPLFWYAVRDAGDDRSEPEDNFGLRHRDFSAKPAWDALVLAIADAPS